MLFNESMFLYACTKLLTFMCVMAASLRYYSFFPLCFNFCFTWVKFSVFFLTPWVTSSCLSSSLILATFSVVGLSFICLSTYLPSLSIMRFLFWLICPLIVLWAASFGWVLRTLTFMLLIVFLREYPTDLILYGGGDWNCFSSKTLIGASSLAYESDSFISCITGTT